MIYCFDCDGVICDTQGTSYENATPKEENIKKINRLYDAGNHITIFTGRGTVTGIDWRDVTEKQFAGWGLKYHELIFGKPPFDLFVDDHCINVKDFEEDEIMISLDYLEERLRRELDWFIEHEGKTRPYQVFNLLQSLSLKYLQLMDAKEANERIQE